MAINTQIAGGRQRGRGGAPHPARDRDHHEPERIENAHGSTLSRDSRRSAICIAVSAFEFLDITGKQHLSFFARPRPRAAPTIAVVRPYNVRALADIDGRHPQDLFFTGAILGDVIQRQKRPYDPYEPRTMAELSAAELRRYSLIVAEAGVLTRAELEPIARAERPGIVFIEGADREGLNAELTGVTNFERTVRGAPVPLGPLSATAEAADL